MYVLGISAYTHDSAICLLKGDKIVFALEEERLSKLKHDSNFPKLAFKQMLKETNLDFKQLKKIAFFEKPLLRFERMFKYWLANPLNSYQSMQNSLGFWLKNRLPPKNKIILEIASITNWQKDLISQKLSFYNHHQSHAASSYFASGFKESAILVLDGVGEYNSTSIWHAFDNQIKPLYEINFPNSLGLFYAAFTSFLGFELLGGEYKFMALSAYGEPTFIELLKKHFLNINQDSSYSLNAKYFNFLDQKQVLTKEAIKLLGLRPKTKEADYQKQHFDLASSVQHLLEEVILNLAQKALSLTQSKNLCLAGGVSFNGLSNQNLIDKKILNNLFISPVSNDCGTALGAASLALVDLGYQKPSINMQDNCFSMPINNQKVKELLEQQKLSFKKLNSKELVLFLAKELYLGELIAIARGKLEFGPRALGNRSILANPLLKETKAKVNLAIKNREEFRPFAAMALETEASKYFELKQTSAYMLFDVKVKTEALLAVTHQNQRVRLQTINKETNPFLFEVLFEFAKLSGYAVLLNTSLNLRDEPICANEEDCLAAFLNSSLNYLLLGDYLVFKK